MRGLNLLICLLAMSYLPGQDLISLEENWTEHEISTVHGLSSDVIEAVIQDGSGTFWIGSEMTVDRIDLTANRPFSYKQKGGLSGYGFRAFAMAQDSFLFVGNTANVFKINIHSPNATFKSLELGNMGVVNSLAIQSDSLLWIAGAYGLERRSIDGADNEYLLPLKGGVRKLHTSGERLYLLHGDTLKLLALDNEPELKSIHTFSFRTTGTCKDFLVHNDTVLWTDGFNVSLTTSIADITIIDRPKKAGIINKLIFDRAQNQLLLCTTNGLEIWGEEAGIYRRIIHKFRGGNILTAYVDAAGNLWISQNRSSLIYVHRPKPSAGLEVLRLPDTLGRGINATWSVVTRENYLYWGTDRGLFVTRLGMPDSTIKIADINEKVTVLRLLGDTLLIGTLKGKLFQLSLDKSGKTAGYKPDSITSFENPIRSIALDGHHNLFVGLADVSRDNGKKQESLYRKAIGSSAFQLVSGFLDRDAYTLEYIDDTMYVGTSRGEVLRFDKSLTLDTVWQWKNDPVLTITRIDNSLLVGTFYGGLHRVEDSSSTSILSDYPSLFNAVYSVVEDSDGNWWLATDQGIHRFSKETEACTFNSWDIRHGLQGIDFNKGSFFFDAGDGSLFFGGENGLNRAWPDRFSFHNTAYFTAEVATKTTSPEDWNNLVVNIEVRDPTGTTPFGILYGFMTDRDSILVTEIFDGKTTSPQLLESFQPTQPTKSGTYTLAVTRYQNGVAQKLPFYDQETSPDWRIERPWSVWLRANWLFFILPLLILLTIFLYRKNQAVNENLEDTKEELTELKRLFGVLIETWRGPYDKLLLNFSDVLLKLDLGKEQVSIIEVTDDGNGLLQQSHFLLKNSRKIESKTVVGENNFCFLCVQKAQKLLAINPGIYPHEAILVEGDIDANYQKYGFDKKPLSTPEDATRSFIFLPLVKRIDNQLKCIGAISTQDATPNKYASNKLKAMIQVLAEQVGHNVLFRVTVSDVLEELQVVRENWPTNYPDIEPFHSRGGWFKELPTYYSILIKLFDQDTDALLAWIEPFALEEDEAYPDAHPLNVAVKSIVKAPEEKSDLTITWIVLLLLGSRTRNCDNTEQRLAIYEEEFSSFKALLTSDLDTPDRRLIDTAIRDNPLLCLATDELKEVMNLLVRLFALLSIDKYNKRLTNFILEINWDDNLPRLICRWRFSQSGNLASLNRLHQRNAARNSFHEVGKVLYDLMDQFGSNFNFIADGETYSLKLVFTPYLSIKNKV